MFESPDLGAIRTATDAEVVAAVAGWGRDEAAATARRLAWIAELVRRRCARGEHADWACDDWDGAAAEIAAALGISHGRASGQMQLAQSLVHRLPTVMRLFCDGVIGYRTAAAISSRTALVQDREALRLIDGELAGTASRFGPLSNHKLDQAIDTVVDRHDPGALRRTRTAARARHLDIGAPDDPSGTTSVSGQLLATDAILLDRRLMEMAHGVCDDDPRTISQRRADALGALGAGADRLTCRCGSPDCPAGAKPDARATSVVVHVLADDAALDAALECRPDPHLSGSEPSRPITPRTSLAEALTPDPEPEPTQGPASRPSPALLLGGGAIPAPLLAELIAGGATVRTMRDFCDSAPETGYRPSTALREFVRMRDLTCRFPGCDCPADRCDIDHAIAWPAGPTHPSGLRCMCRKHHLLKTFYAGPGGWSDVQSPDGTIVWTSPTGATYTTYPGSRLYHPASLFTTPAYPATPAPEPAPTDLRTLRMPLRQRTRIQDRARRTATERALNAGHVAERSRPPPF